MKLRPGPSAVSAAVLFLLLALAPPAGAYVGPGAGFGMVTSFLVFLNAFLASLLSVLLWPVAMAVRLARRARLPHRPEAGRLVILGLDGLSPDIVSSLVAEGGMPAFAELCRRGRMTRLGTTCPGISPVAWSSFMTGVNPGKHGIFDFLAPDRKRYLARLSSVTTGSSEHETRLGPLRLRRRKAFARLLRKSSPFWGLLGRFGIRSIVLRVPVTYPPEPLDGQLLSGMCVPDLRGTQGSCTVLGVRSREEFTGGLWSPLEKVSAGTWKGSVPGPETDTGASSADVLLRRTRKGWTLDLPGGAEVPLREGRLTGWVRMTFRIGRSKVRGITMFCLTLDGTDPVLYCTALNVDPYYPVVPVSRPVHYSRYLAGMHGPFATLGLAEDTWALNNSIIGEDVFLEQAWSIFEERKRMFFDAMDRRGTGLVVCVFDTSDRIQHMFWSQGTGKGSVIRDMYARMDALLGETVGRLRKRDRLIVMSDHGFTSFSTCVDWNRWLVEEGYMVLEEGTDSIPTGFHGVDWSRTRAYSIGLAGIYLNLRGREARGTVNPGDEASELLDEMSERLLALVTPNGNRVVRSVSRADRTYRGPYAADGPDLVPGTEAGFRTGWNCATGGVGPEVLYENNLHWDGDHCHDRTLVPGILVTSWKHGSESPEIMDIAPTALRMLGVEPPGWMDGTPLAPEDDVEPA